MKITLQLWYDAVAEATALAMTVIINTHHNLKHDIDVRQSIKSNIIIF
jgi:hypothetical protein